MIVIRRKFILLMILIATIIPLVFFAASKKTQNVDSTPIEKTQEAKFKPKNVPAGSDSTYEMNLTLNQEGMFHLDSSIVIKNTSEDPWKNLVFYFIPNLFTKERYSHLEHPATIQFNEVTINGEASTFELEGDTLTIPLKQELQQGKKINVTFDYQFTLPSEGKRFTKSLESYYLAQFYPMVATYRNHKWNKEGYRFDGESYHTAFSDFKVKYTIPDDYTFVSTNENDKSPSDKEGTFEVKNTKELFIALLKDPSVIEKNEGNVNIRVFGLDKNKPLYKAISKEAASTLTYFQEHIGPYPFKQLDIIIDQQGMEYPGILTAPSISANPSAMEESLKRTVVHEIAHQWFYGVISNDPYHDAWLDEGFAEFATMLYQYSNSKEKVPYKLMYKQVEDLKPLPVNLSLGQYEDNSAAYIYGKSNTMLWKLFEKRGGKKEAERFLKSYYKMYSYKEVNTQEFVRFAQYYFNFKDQKAFKEWLEL
ncbi:M1 family metallopeptidase [Priestia filamentosa]|uniref:M1 family metallopeptidase n=1 Tax=Priestia filamentosa TaxID=1402861 RepID=UPI003F13F95F